MRKIILTTALIGGALFASPTVSEAAFGNEGTLTRGDVSASVNALQLELKKQGHFQGSTGSTFGPRTLSAVKSFQLEHNISSPTGKFYGVAGPQTMRTLHGTNDSSSVSNSPTLPTNTSSNEKVAGVSQTNSASSLIDTARTFEGTPYVWGGTSPRGFDCSGFLQYVHGQNGVSIPRTVASIYSASTKISSPERGALVFFETYQPGASHAGIYLGNGDFIHAGSSTGVTVSNMDSPYWSQRYIGAGRMN